ncbi:DUF3500 domain-containing protein [Salinifilum aidingensis]
MTSGCAAAEAMRAAMLNVLGALDDAQRARVRYSFADDRRLRWSYVPESRPGVRLADLGRDAAKAAHQLLATALSPRAFAQATTIMGLEEVLDRVEGGEHGRHRGHYWIAVFGSPDEDAWSWRFEGHHLSVTATVTGSEVSPTPLFLGAHPAAISYAERPGLRPLCWEEDLARAVLEELSPQHRRRAVVSDRPPNDIRTASAAQAPDHVDPLGVPRRDLGPSAAACLDQLLSLYLGRFNAGLVGDEAAALERAADDVHFAWEGPRQRGSGHYYRVQAPGLLVEYDNTQNEANHAHSVVRRPGDDFGAQLLGAHYATSHGFASSATSAEDPSRRGE